MKRIVLSAALALLAFGTGAEAQVTVPAKPNTFSTVAECREALASGRLRFYEPKYFGLRTQNPTNGVDRVVVPLESTTCLQMLVVGGLQYVAQLEGTLFRARKLADGSLILYARDDCGNPVYGVVYPPPPPAEPAPQQQVREPVVLAPQPFRQEPPQPPERVFAQRSRERETDANNKKKGGFCSSKTCRVLVVVGVVAGGGYAAYRYWPCPPGTVRR